MTKTDHILLLAGTFEARRLAKQLSARFSGSRLTASFAGVVKDLPDLDVPTRTGGFGGVAGLSSFLCAERITLVIDATHPFAAQMSRNAADACAALQLPLIRLERPVWTSLPDDTWRHFDTMQAASRALPRGARAFLAVGRKEIRHFTSRDDIFGLARMIEAPPQPLPAGWDLLLQRPSQSAFEEADLLRNHGITHVVTKNSGGGRAYAKIEAARWLKLPVFVIDRPQLPEAETAADIEGVLEKAQFLTDQTGS
ncbi:cobalt-precorrin-6A reductase [Roseibium sp.]|uniref:cobalt-precorrin-6A reductase n=1 Tax=Roseibium sp. TaxID=1936156 RepID=UPI003B50595D